MDGGSGQCGRRSSEAAALGEEGATDGGFGLERCSLKDAAASEEGMRKECSTERKAAPAAREGMTRLSEMEVLRHLTRDPRRIAPYNMENLRGFAEQVRPNLPEEVLRMVVDSFNDKMMKQFSVFQNWVRGEFQEKGYVEVPDEVIREREEASKQQGEEIDLYLPDRHFTTVVGDDGKEKLVFSFKKEEMVVSESKSSKGDIFVSYSAGLHPEVKAACRKMSPGKEPDQDV